MALNAQDLMQAAKAAIESSLQGKTVKTPQEAHAKASSKRNDIAGHLVEGEYVFVRIFEDSAKIGGEVKDFDAALFLNKDGKLLKLSTSALWKKRVWTGTDWFEASCPVLDEGQVVSVKLTEGLVTRYDKAGNPMPATSMVSPSGEPVLTIVDQSGQRMLAKKSYAMTITVA